MTAEDRKLQTAGEEQEACAAPADNVRCRICRVVDGYRRDESECRFCGARLFRGEAI